MLSYVHCVAMVVDQGVIIMLVYFAFVRYTLKYIACPSTQYSKQYNLQEGHAEIVWCDINCAVTSDSTCTCHCMPYSADSAQINYLNLMSSGSISCSVC